MPDIFKISQSKAVEFFKKIGYPKADEWDSTKLEKVLSSLDQAIDDETEFEDEEIEAFIVEIKYTIKNGIKIQIIPEEKEEEKQNISDVLEDKDAEFVDSPPKEFDTKEVIFTPPEPRKHIVVKSKLAPSRVGPKVKGKLQGVKSLKNRLFFAGMLIKRDGLGQGITQALLDEVDGMSKKSNMKVTKTQTQAAWHAINGFVNGEIPEKKTETETIVEEEKKEEEDDKDN